MSATSLNMSAIFWPRSATLPTIEDQYQDLWRFAKALEGIGIPLDDWYPPADTPEGSMLNQAFTATGASTPALAMAKADKANHATDLRSLGAWNGIEGEGGAVFTTFLKASVRPSSLDFSAKELAPLQDHANALKLMQAAIDIWSPALIELGTYGYDGKAVFNDRPAVSWMIYLPLAIETNQAPEASLLVPVLDAEGERRGTIVVSVLEQFDAQNPEHVKRANDIEVRLADQDLLPRRMDFMKFRPVVCEPPRVLWRPVD